ncbi:MAG TPA: ImmA/IrrE family metallo-endopeptidase [Rickettsiales bacterium]|nr:ImmA/IrrE family metallo-endopeptidase [Rickettsiales bacterium]
MQEKFNHTLLLLARQYRDKSQAEVAESAGLNQGHYSRIENGLLPDGPSYENVSRIAEVLAFPVPFFYQSDNMAGLPLSVHPMHRKKESVREGALKRIHAELNLRLIHIRKMLAAVETKAVLPLPWIDVDEGGGPKEIARKIRNAWLLPPGPISNLTECVEQAGIYVVWCNFDAAIDGVTMRLRDLPPCIFLNRAITADRMRFSLAHELGHIIMHRVPTDNIEDEANIFAAELLVPEKELRNDLIGGRITLERLARLKARWKVSMQSLLYQAGEKGYLSKNQSQYLWKQISSLGWRTREPEETDFAYEEPQLFPKIIDLHIKDLEYGMDEFQRLLNSERNDLQVLYGLQDNKSLLRLIK